MIRGAYLVVACDFCEDELSIPLEEMAGGEWSILDLEEQLKAADWQTTADGKHYCDVDAEPEHTP